MFSIFQGGYTSPLGLTVVAVLLLFLRSITAQPVLTLEEFTVFALKSPSSPTNRNNTINFKLSVYNWDSRVAYHDAMNVTFYYTPTTNNINNNINQIIGNTTFGPLYQSDYDYDNRNGYFEARGVAFDNVEVPLNFRVEVSSAVRYELNLFFKSRRLSYVVGANVKVDSQGNLIKRKHNKGIELSSNARRENMGHVHMLVGLFLFILFFFHSW